MGPTACGKTQTALELVQTYPLEIISVDAAMVYRGMDIGTAKPDQATLKHIPHHLIDIREPNESYSTGQFCQDAVIAIENSFAKGKFPLLVGGTMLYFYTLQQGLSPLPQANLTIREALNHTATRIGWAALHEKLAKIDPQTAARIPAQDTQRISRALEIYQITGQPWSTLITRRQPYVTYPIIHIALSMNDRIQLHQRITARFDIMLAQGFVAEVEKLFARGDLSAQTPSMRTVGYRQIWRYLTGELSFAQMREQSIIATRQLAKRQITWLRQFPNAIRWDETKQSHAFEKIFSCYTE